MKKLTGIFATIIIGLSLGFGGIQDAEAKRFGGGSSFGGKSAFRMPYKKSIAQPSRSASQQQAFTKNQAAKKSLANRGGLMGMLGGLALGGLLGAMFFGGAFEGFNFMDILMFGGIAYLLYRMFAAKAGANQRSAYSRTSQSDQDTSSTYASYDEPKANTGSAFDTDILFKKDKNNDSDANFDQHDTDYHEWVLPKGFDEAAFLTGAKSAYKTLQAGWDSHDLAEIRGLTTDKVFIEIQDQINSSTVDNVTEILSLDAKLLDLREIGSEIEVVVLFDSIMREEADEQAGQVREIWHFIKQKNSVQPKWFLDGIQQLEN